LKKRLVALLAGVLTVLSMGFGLAQFSDVPAGHWAREAVEVLSAKGIITGFPDGTFRGNETLTRYQAALIIYRLLQQIERELSTGGSKTLEGLNPEDLEVLRNAISELAAELAALGIRVAQLEESHSELKAAVAGLAAPGEEPGMDARALAELGRALESLSLQLESLSARLSAGEQELEELRSDLQGTRADIEALRATLDEYGMQMEGASTLLLQFGRALSALEERLRALEARPALTPQDLEGYGFATRDQVEGLRKLVADLKGEDQSLRRSLEEVRGEVEDLKKTRITLGGSAEARFSYSTSMGGSSFDIDRLFPGSPFGSGGFNPVGEPDTAPSLGLSGSAELRLGLAAKDPLPLEARFSLRGDLLSSPDVSASLYFDEVSVKGTGKPSFSVLYKRNLTGFAFGSYLLSNRGDGTEGNPRYGVRVELEGSPSLTLVAGVGEAGKDPNPALSGPFAGVQASFLDGKEPWLTLAYAAGSNRKAVGLTASLRLGPLEGRGEWVSSDTLEGGLPELLSPQDSDWAYYGRLAFREGGLFLSLSYHLVSPAFSDGRAGLSEDHDLDYYGGRLSPPPYRPGTQGIGGEAALSLGPVAIAGFLKSERDFGGAPGTVRDWFGVRASLALPLGLKAAAEYQGAYASGDSYFAFASGVDALPFFDPVESPEGATRYGVRLEHEGKEGALVPGLLLGGSWYRYPVSGYGDAALWAGGSWRTDLLSVAFAARGHSFSGGGPSGDYLTLKGGAEAELLLGPFSLSGALGYRQTSYRGNGTVVTAPDRSEELLYRVSLGTSLGGWTLRGGYAYYTGSGLPSPIGLGAADGLKDPYRDGLFADPGRGAPWNQLPGGSQGRIAGFFVSAELSGFQLAYGEFSIATTLGDYTDWVRSFSVRYKQRF